jgi:molecular chaperone DnaK
MTAILGIDFGTTNSAVAAAEDGRPVPIPNPDGGTTTPSLVAFDGEGRVIAVGRQARDEASRRPGETVHSVKRLMGRMFESVAEEVAGLPYRVEAGPSGEAEIALYGRRLSPAQVAAHVLRRLKEDAERHLGREVGRAVIGVPAYFDDLQRQATRDAARLAGLEVVRLLNEPTAAALAYGIDLAKDQRIAVYDFGGGTFDVSILQVTRQVTEVLATCGDTRLGGDDIDRRVASLLCADGRLPLPAEPARWRRLQEAVERAKVRLSAERAATVELAGDGEGRFPAASCCVAHGEFEDMIQDFVERTLAICRSALGDARLGPGDVDEVILVGGSTRIPLVRRRLGEFFGRAPRTTVDPDLAVALGAALQAATLERRARGAVLLDVTALSLGIETLEGLTSVIIPRNTTIPARRTKRFSTAEDGQGSVTVHVVQGERPLARDNRSLGKFNLEGLPALPRGMPEIEVAFDIDADGLVHVAAAEASSGARREMTVTGAREVGADQAEALVAEARRSAERDREAADAARERLRAHHLLAGIARSLRRQRRRIDLPARRAVDAAVREARSALRSGEPARVERSMRALDDLLSRAGLRPGADAAPASPRVTPSSAGTRRPCRGA